MLEKKKTGGPYPKDERVKRQNEVSRLHFEYGYSATKISEMMNVNRNTINQDIKNLYLEIRDEFRENSEGLILKQIGRLESQRSRITENLKEIKSTEDAAERIRYEKLLLDVDSKINDMLSKINSKLVEKSPNKVEVQEEQVKDLILLLIVKYSQNPCIDKEEILCNILNFNQCNTDEAERMFSHIVKLGLGYCKKFDGEYHVFDLLEFAFLRRYILTNDPFVAKIHGLCILKNHLEVEKDQLGKEFKKRYGDRKNWRSDVFVEFQKEQEKIGDNYAESSGKIVIDALENISDKSKIEKYLRCINLYFGKENKSLIKKMLGI